MTMFRLVALLALILVTPATAQMSVPRIRPIAVEPVTAVPQGDQLIVDPWTNPDTARRVIEQLRAERSELKSSLGAANGRLADALAKIDALTTPGGSLVRAYCASPTVSRNTAGAEEDCADSGYRCDQVSGLCHRSATSSQMCSAGFNWDARSNQCVQ